MMKGLGIPKVFMIPPEGDMNYLYQISRQSIQ